MKISLFLLGSSVPSVDHQIEVYLAMVTFPQREILMNSFCEDNTRSSTLLPLVGASHRHLKYVYGSSTCCVRKQSCVSSRKASLSAALSK